jgi:hypothetical protein
MVASVWCKPHLLGTREMSKSVTPEDYGSTKLNPHRALLVLRAWMLHKARHNNFCNENAARRRLFTKEAEDLRRDILALCPGSALLTTGNERADNKIREWAPQCMM